MYGLTTEDLALQPRARAFTDELIPFEERPRMNDGELPDGIVDEAAGTRDRARPVRHQHAAPRSAAGAAPPSSRCWSRSRAAGSPTRSPGCLATPPSWWADVATDDQRETLAAADGPRRDGRVLRDHRGGRRLRRRRPRGHRRSRRRRLRPQRREVARHVVQRGRLRVLPGRAHRRRARRRARAVRRRHGRAGQCASCARRRTRTRFATTTRSSRSTTSGCRRRTSSAARATA